MIRLRLFGHLELHDAEGRELAALLAQPKRVALLAYLAAAEGFQRRDTLLALFWPELDETHARASLNQAVRFLRKALGASAESVIVSRGAEELGIDRTRLWCDVVAFREDVASRRYGEALELYRGDLLEGFHASGSQALDEWLESERVAFRAQAARAARELAAMQEGDRRYTTAVANARRAVELSPDDERTLRELLELLDRLGDRAGAIHAYEAFAARLAERVGVEPAAETTALFERIRARRTTPEGGARDQAADRGASDVREVAPVSAPMPGPPTAGLPPANVRIDQWVLERELARGGSAVVYLARDVKHDRHVAFKALRPEIAVTLGAESFVREIQITAQLAHPHILPLIDSGARDRLLYFVTPYLPGESLRERLEREGALPVDEVVSIAGEIAEALDYAHRRGVLHRDIKPENILLADGHAVVADFGVARALAASGGDQAVVGTPGYISPEQLSPGGGVSTRADVYSLGCVMFEMLTQRRAAGDEGARDIQRWRPDVPEPMAQLVARCVAREPERRPERADDVKRALERSVRARSSVGEDTTLTQHERESGARPLRVWRARRWRWAIAASLVFGGLGFSAWSYADRMPDNVLDENVVAVFPFRVSAPDSSLNYLREAVVDLHNVVLTGDGLPRAVDSRAILSAYKRAAGANGGDLTVEQAMAVAKRLRAGRAVFGEVVSTRGGMTMSARLMGVAAGDVIARHSESGAGDELHLIRRLVSRLLAKSMGEAAGRLAGLSDSVDAVKAYLAGLRAMRSGRNPEAFNHFGKALEIDSTFAAAALWRGRVGWGAFVFGNPPIRRAQRAAWSLRSRMSPRDVAILVSLPAIGPNYPATSTVTDILQAHERAGQANPDRAEVLTDWAHYLSVFGYHAGVDSRNERVKTLLDSALALDPGFAHAVRRRLILAVEQGDTTAVRQYAARLRSLADSLPPGLELVIARALRDTATVDSLRSAVASRPVDAFNVFLWSTHLRFVTMDDAERVGWLVRQRAESRGDKTGGENRLVDIAAIRGQRTRALALADSLQWSPWERRQWIHLALTEGGYDSAADRAAGALHRSADSLLRLPDTLARHQFAAQFVCDATLWRIVSGDTSGARRRIQQMRDNIRRLDPGQAFRAGPLELCPLLLEAAIEQRQPRRSTSPALARVHGLLQRGVWEVPGNVANLLVARWLEAQGDPRAALDIVKRTDPMAATIVHPALWRMRGRLSALAGDTADAIHAYTRFLEVRDKPDPGPQLDEVQTVRRHLDELTRKR